MRVAIPVVLGFALSLPHLPAAAQTTPLLRTGDSAAAQLAYHGTPLHPFCFDFSLERLSRATPFILASCTGTGDPAESDTGGWHRAEYRALQPGRIVAYRALASLGNRFLIATETYGYGSGQFSSLFWIRLDTDRVAVVRDVATGDRCAGGMSRYTVDHSAVRFRITTPTRDIIRLSGVPVPDSVRARLRNGYYACDGDAIYRYDLSSQRKTLLSVTLDTTGAHIYTLPSLGGPPREAVQICFDRLAREYVVSARQALSLTQLTAFVHTFLARCAG